MKKKILIAICAVFIVSAVFGMVLFVVMGKSTETEKMIDLSGTWEVCATVQDGVPSLVTNEFMSFDSEVACDYRDGDTVPYVTSKYQVVLEEAPKLKLTEISKTYVIDIKTDNCISLYENKNSHISLIRYPNQNRSPVKVEPSSLLGEWKVVYRNTDKVIDESLKFEKSQFLDYRNGEKEAYMVSSYSWIDNATLMVDQLGKTIHIHPFADDLIFLVEDETCDIWEIKKKD